MFKQHLHCQTTTWIFYLENFFNVYVFLKQQLEPSNLKTLKTLPSNQPAENSAKQSNTTFLIKVLKNMSIENGNFFFSWIYSHS